jgi:hypothetical protein
MVYSTIMINLDKLEQHAFIDTILQLCLRITFKPSTEVQNIRSENLECHEIWYLLQ